MIVIIIPNILVSKRDHSFFLYDINNFKTLLFEIPDGKELLVTAEGLAIAANGVIDRVVKLRRFFFHVCILLLVLVQMVDLDQFLLLVLNCHKIVVH
jgi:hypothetical protein